MLIAWPAVDDFTRASRSLDTPWHRYVFGWLYHNWSGRWAGVGLAITVLPRVDLAAHYTVLLTGLALANVTAAYAVCRVLLGPDAPRRVALGATAVLVALLWAGLPHTGSTVYWVTGGIENLLSVSASAVLLLCLLNQAPRAGSRLTRAANVGLLAVAGFVIPALHELFGLMLCVALVAGTAVAYRTRADGRGTWLLVTACAIAGLAVVVAAPGNGARAANGTYYALRHQVGLTLRLGVRQAVRYTTGWLLDPKLIAASLLVAISPALARWSPRAWRSAPGGRGPGWRWVLPVTWAAMLAVSFFAMSWATGREMPGRTLSGTYVVFVTGWLAIVHLWTRDAAPCPAPLTSAAWGLLALALLFSGNTRRSWDDWRHHVRPWRSAIAQRYERLRSAAARGETEVALRPLPRSPRLLDYPDVTAAPQHYQNWSIGRYFRIGTVRLAEADAASTVPSPGSRTHRPAE